MKNLPEHLSIIRNQVVDHVISGSPLPENFIELITWFETNAWDDLVSGWGNECITLNLGYLSSRFSDQELIADFESNELITDKSRISYARKLIADTFEVSDGYDCPSVHAVKLQKNDSSTAVLGWTVEIHGQGGAVAVYQGVFLDKEHYYQHLRDCDFVLDTEQDQVLDETILRFWAKPIEPKRSIVISVEWGNEQHECPMSEQTWQRIVKGKPVRRVEPYWYEGKKYRSEWLFNLKEVGQLIVNYDDSGVAFEGNLDEAYITLKCLETTWIKERQKLDLL